MKRSALFTAAVTGGSLVAGAAALAPNTALSNPTLVNGCKVPGGNEVAFFSANTNKGGDGEIVFVDEEGGFFCEGGFSPEAERLVNFDAFNPLDLEGAFVVTDPGNSVPD
jgi:hypothetical protein